MRVRTGLTLHVGTVMLAALGMVGCATTVEETPPSPVVVPAAPAPPPPPPAPRAKATVAPVPPPAPKVEAEAAPEPPRPVVVTRPSDVETLVAEFQRLRRLSPPEITREQDAARQAFAQSRTDTTRVRYAMTLGLPGTAPADEARALEMLDPLVRNSASALNGLAILLASYVQEQRKLGLQVQALQQKLEALRALERNLTERRSGTR